MCISRYPIRHCEHPKGEWQSLRNLNNVLLRNNIDGKIHNGRIIIRSLLLQHKPMKDRILFFLDINIAIWEQAGYFVPIANMFLESGTSWENSVKFHINHQPPDIPPPPKPPPSPPPKPPKPPLELPPL